MSDWSFDPERFVDAINQAALGSPAFDPAGFADTVEDWLENLDGMSYNDYMAYLTWGFDFDEAQDKGEDDIEMYILFAVEIYNTEGFKPCSGCSEC